MRLKWNSELPTVSGQYWSRPAGGDRGSYMVVLVATSSDTGSSVAVPGANLEEYDYSLESFAGYEWAGPIEEPED